MNSAQYTQIGNVSRGIRFKEYLLNRDVSSRRIIIDLCIRTLTQSPKVVIWLQNLRSINDQIDAKDRKEQIKTDAFWDDLILIHSADPQFSTIMGMLMNTNN